MSATAPTLPFDDETRFGPGGNNPPPDFALVRSDFDNRVAAFLKGLDVWAERETLDEATAPRARDFHAGLKKLAKEAEEARRTEKKPHEEAAKAVDAWWKTVGSKLDKAAAVIAPKIDAWLKEEQRKKDAAAAEARRVAAEAEAERRRAAEAAANATTESARIEAEEREAAAAAQVRTATKASTPEKARVASATGLASRASTRKEWSALITEPSRAVLHYRNHPEIVEVIKRLALRDLRDAPTEGGQKQIPAIPGIVFNVEEKFA